MPEDQTPPMSRPRLAAGALFFDDDGRVLLVKPTYKEGWDIPGGYVEPAESPKEACRREIKEELNLDLEVGPLLVVDWAPSPNEGDKVLFVFDAGVIDTRTRQRIALPPDELASAQFFDPQEFGPVLPARLVRRIDAALTAKRDRTARYLEHGRRVPNNS